MSIIKIVWIELLQKNTRCTIMNKVKENYSSAQVRCWMEDPKIYKAPEILEELVLETKAGSSLGLPDGLDGAGE